jgi:type II secretory pathway pseudopilin PulG
MRARRHARRSERGFTLIELTVSMVGGLIIALGVIALSREASSSFNEEVRLSAAEASVRTAVDRLRSDLQRAGYMSTGNIARDPRIAGGLLLGNSNVSATANSKFKGLGHLAGVHLYFGGSASQTPLSAAQAIAPPAASASAAPAALEPDAIELGGNFTSNDQFVARNIDLPSGSCQRIWLAVDSPPMYRILATSAPKTNFAAAFQPILQSSPTSGSASSYQYLVRIADDTGRYQYAATCPTATGGADSAPPSPWVDIDVSSTLNGTGLLTPQQTATTGGVAGLGVGRITVNPIQIVRWEIGVPTALYSSTALTQLGAALNPSGDPNKYDLIRSFVDATGKVVPESTEVVAEYAIDLKFAFTVDADTHTLGATDPNTQTGGPVYQMLSFDSPANGAWAPDVSQWLLPASTPLLGPQRIRSVRVRLVSRSAIADRTSNIAPTPANPAAAPSGSTSELFLYRYCAGQITGDAAAPVMPTCNGSGWARARTVTTEVDLPNQAGMHFL